MRRTSSLLYLTVFAFSAAVHAQVTPPDKFFGYQLGSDRKLARWDKIVDYFRVLQKQSTGKMRVVNMGPSTMGHPFLLAIISSPANLQRLEELRVANLKISDPRGVNEAEVRKLVAAGKAVVCQTMSLHATEVGGSQMAPELAYDLISRDDTDTRRILDEVILLLIPCFNPDGQTMVTDYYNKYIGTAWEGGPLPWLYHKYAGHDNNRDAFQTNLVESRYLASLMFRDWIPQAYVDHHHMGSYGARIYVPPYAEPIRPHGDPLVWREMAWYGGHIAYKEEEAGLSGVINAAQYSGWGHFGFHWITPFHNIAGMLTESASAKIASPLFIHPDQLRGNTRAMPDYNPQTTFPNPWPGGWWRLRDIVERQKVSAWAVLDLMARNRETVLRNAYLKAKRQTERGASGKPAAFVIAAAQHDPLTAVKLLNKLLIQGIEIHEAPKGFATTRGMTYGPGSYVVSMAQPKSGVIRYLLGRTFYPDNDWTRARDGSPIRPYDMATDTMFEFMGVRVDPLDEEPKAGLLKLIAAIEPPPRVLGESQLGYAFDGRLNDSFRAANLLLDKGVAVSRVHKAGNGLAAGDFVAGARARAMLESISKETLVSFSAIGADFVASARPVKRMRTAMYQRYRGGNMDEGWTRLLLEQFNFPYTTIMDAEVKKGSLNDRFDVIILPDDSTAAITGERPAGERSRRPADEPYPPEYRSGIGEEGVKALTAFVEKGGTLLALGSAGNFAIEKLGLSVRNIVANRSTKEFWCPGSTLKATFDTAHPLAYGMPAEGLVLYLGGNPVFEVTPGARNEDYKTVVRYAERDLLESGWLIGGEHLARRPAMIAAKLGEGRVILTGFRPQHRAQTHGTYKLLFNALLQ
jgi:hypothetical protein